MMTISLKTSIPGPTSQGLNVLLDFSGGLGSLITDVQLDEGLDVIEHQIAS